jgi:hypothetical protein
VTTYRKLSKVEELIDGRMYFRRGINPGDIVIEDRCKYTVTQNALDCDCGKGVFCPYVIQEKN